MLTENFLRRWRESYSWLDSTREASEARILRLENLVVENIFRNGPSSWKDVLSELWTGRLAAN